MAELSNLPVSGALVPIDTPLAEGRSHVVKKKRNKIPKQTTKKEKEWTLVSVSLSFTGSYGSAGLVGSGA